MTNSHARKLFRLMDFADEQLHHLKLLLVFCILAYRSILHCKKEPRSVNLVLNLRKSVGESVFKNLTEAEYADLTKMYENFSFFLLKIPKFGAIL